MHHYIFDPKAVQIRDNPEIRCISWQPCATRRISYFGATIGRRALSNLSSESCLVIVDGIAYPTTEHAYQARLWDPEFRWMFGVEGPLSSFEGAVSVGFNFGLKNSTAENIKAKIKFWDKRCCGAIGIVPKILSNRKNNSYKSVNVGGIQLPPPNAEHDFGVMTEDEFWVFILTQKFQDGDAKNLLLQNEDTLVEFDRGAGKRGSFWGGVVQKNTVKGYNYMGGMLMIVRSLLLKKSV